MASNSVNPNADIPNPSLSNQRKSITTIQTESDKLERVISGEVAAPVDKKANLKQSFKEKHAMGPIQHGLKGYFAKKLVNDLK